MILTEEMERTLRKAWEEAKKRRNEFITLEHILLALTYDSVAKEVLEACGADIERLRKDLIDYLESELESFPESSGEVDPIYTIGVQHVLQLAEFHVQSTRNKKNGWRRCSCRFISRRSIQRCLFFRFSGYFQTGHRSLYFSRDS
ncbi:Clp amino terminal domain protein [Leptospira interrogans serovar Canicola]|nr:Clp amino terminal domain protein [Leptospira interrogans serovar Canicola]